MLQDACMHDSGWNIEVLSWQHCVNHHLKQWAMKFGLFIDLDAYYMAITFLKSNRHG